MLAYIRKHDLVRAGDRVGAAVSGGADSVALLRLMLEFKDELGIILSVVHLNHKLRGEESDGDEQFVRDLAAAHGLEFICESRDVRAHAREKRLSIETAAREVRYDFFRCLLQSNLNRIATAHTQDDQAETVLLKLTRGAGTRGLAGIYPKLVVGRSSVVVSEEARSSQQSAFSEPLFRSRSVRGNQATGADLNERAIVRPVLHTSRAQLHVYLAEISQDWREDSTNQDLQHTRNRIRHQLLPLIEKEINRSVRGVLAETAEIAREEEKYWASEVGRVLPETWHRGELIGRFELAALRASPVALQRRLARAAAESLGLTVEFRHVEEILGLTQEGDCASLPDSWMAIVRGKQIELRQSSREVAAGYAYELAVPGRIAIPEAETEIETVLCSGETQIQKYSSGHLVGMAFVQRGLVVRNWQPGERFWPAHTKEPRKIKELLQDRHITGERKKLWPVVASGDEIVWLRGFGVRRDFQSSDGKGILIREVGKKTEESGTEPG